MNGVPDWRFPLVSRVADAKARQSLTRFLAKAWSPGLLVPRRPTRASDAFAGVTLAAYGSCVEGTARPGSDVDTIGILGPDAARAKEFHDLVAEVNLEVDRKIDARFISSAEFEDLPVPVRHDLRSAKTIFRSDHRCPFLEAVA